MRTVKWSKCITRKRMGALLLGTLSAVLWTLVGLPFVLKSDHDAWAGFTLPPAPWGEFTPFYGAAPCIPDFQDVGIFSPADAKADAVVDKLLKKRLLGEDDVAEIRKYDEQDRDRRANRNFQGNLSYRMQTLFNWFEGDPRAHQVDPSSGQTSSTTTIPSRSPLVRPSGSGSSTLYGGSRDAVSDIDVRRLRFQFNGCVYRDMQFHIEFHADGHSIGLRDLDWTWTKIPWMNVMVGQIKMPNSRERQLSSGSIHFAERNFPSQGVAAIGRETGIQLSGMDILDVFDYKVMAASGFGFNKQFQSLDNTNNLVYAGRFTVHPFGRVPFWAGDVWNSWAPLFEASVTYAYAPKALAMGELNAVTSFDLCQAYGATTSTAQFRNNGCLRSNVPDSAGNTITGFTALPLGRANFNDNAIGDWQDLGFDSTFMYRGFYANAEFHNMLYQPSNETASLPQFRNLRTTVWFVDLGYFLIPRTWEVVARYQYMDINSGNVYASSTAITGTTPTTNRRVIDAKWWEFGTVWYLSNDHRHKLGAFGHIRDEMGGDLKNNGFSINMQLAF